MQLRAALLAEGSSDRGLIGILAQIFARKGITASRIDWGSDRLAHHELSGGLAPRIEKLLELEPDYDLLFVHRDADAADPMPRFSEIERAFANQAKRCPYVCVVPVQKLEAWLLADESAILRQVGKKPGSVNLDLPKPKQIEQRARPKEILASALARASARKHASPKALSIRTFGQLRARLLEDLDIDGPVNQLAAWQRLLADIDEAIITLARDRAQETAEPCPPSTSS